MQNQTRKMINSDFLKQSLIRQIRKLRDAIRIEKTCTIDEANKDIVYFIKQVEAIILTSDE